MVEIGTSTFYTSIKDATDEPLLKHICQKIAADELRHYKLFYTHLQRYQAKERLSFFTRFKSLLIDF
jgi:rubrerythrin